MINFKDVILEAHMGEASKLDKLKAQGLDVNNIPELVRNLDKLRKQMGVESEAGVLLGIFQDITVKLRRQKNIDPLLRELKDYSEIWRPS